MPNSAYLETLHTTVLYMELLLCRDTFAVKYIKNGHVGHMIGEHIEVSQHKTPALTATESLQWNQPYWLTINRYRCSKWILMTPHNRFYRIFLGSLYFPNSELLENPKVFWGRTLSACPVLKLIIHCRSLLKTRYCGPALHHNFCIPVLRMCSFSL